MLIPRLLVVGVGLIGGSFALALKQRKLVGEVVGMGRDPANIRNALQLGVIDSAGSDFTCARGVDFILVATPVQQMPAVFAGLLPHLSTNCVVSDAGSTKQDVVAAAVDAFGARCGQLVPGHPIAGREKSGVTAAEAALFAGRSVVLTPQANNSAAHLSLVQSAWEACGAQVTRMGAAQHDAVFAAISHLPHLLAYALVDEIAHRDNAKQLFDFAAGGFRDFTRIASSSPEMWRDIALANRDALLLEIDRFQGNLARLRGLIEDADGAALERLMAEARDRRDAWLARFNADSKVSPE